MNDKMKFEVGDLVRVFTKDEVEVFVDTGGNDLNLLECDKKCHDTAFGKIRKVANVYKDDSNIDLECEDGEFGYFYPEEICELVKKGK